MGSEGYYRFATVRGELLVFVCEDDLWSVPATGGVARKLTHAVGDCFTPRISPDGRQIAFVNLDEGHPEVYFIPSEGGTPARLTYLGGSTCHVAGWSHDSTEVFFTSDARAAYMRHTEVFAVNIQTGVIRPLNVGHARFFQIDASGRAVLGRNAFDPAVWKRYRGGTAGELWVDPEGKGKYRPLIKLPGNLVSPMYIGKRIYFLSDHEGIGNIYSCLPDGSSLAKHTNHTEYYVRFPSTDGKNIAYTAGSRIFLLNIKSDTESLVDVSTPSAAPLTSRKFIPVQKNLESFAPSSDGSIGVISRGQPLVMPLFEGPVVQYGQGNDVRYRLLTWLPDGKKFVVTNDSDEVERLEIHSTEVDAKPAFLTREDIGRVREIAVSPKSNKLALANHRYELIVVDMKTGKPKVIDRSSSEPLHGISWSADGKWLAYSFALRYGTRIIRIADATTGKHWDVTSAVRSDYAPSFDPDGKYLYFLSNRDFNPVYDSQQFDLSFPASCRPYLVTLRDDVTTPFIPDTSPLVGKAKEEPAKESTAKSKDKSDGIEINFEGIQGRVISFPVEEGLYGGLVAASGKIIYSRYTVRGITKDFNWHTDSGPAGKLFSFDFKDKKENTLASDVGDFVLASDNQTLVYKTKEYLRAIDVQQAPKGSDAGSGYSRQTGWIDMNRASVLVEPRKEWQQMYREAWRLQLEQFWVENMSDVDWNLVFERYAILLPRIRTRTELSDLIWEMQGELGTSHAYEFGGDLRTPLAYYKGFLGADLAWNSREKGYKIQTILRGDSWDRECDSPLAEPGLKIKTGDTITAVNGRSVSQQLSVDELLLKAGGLYVQLTIKSGGTSRQVNVRTLKHERFLRYRMWVEGNRQKVHQASKGRLGYVHIPDMGPWGYAEFHRSYLAEFHRDGLVVDARYNRGGHVSGLLLQKLLRKRVGYDLSRWGEPQPYPSESVAGPMVALTNQFAGSDGDIFSHCFKLYELGPLVGKRTWGGVIGIDPRQKLVDGTLTTQPEYSFWFKDVGFKVENYGTDPDFDVDIAPQDYAAGLDPQLEKALELALKALKRTPVGLPDFGARPSLKLPHTRQRAGSRKR